MAKLISDLDFSAPASKMKKGTPVAFDDVLEDDAPVASSRKASAKDLPAKVSKAPHAEAKSIVSTLKVISSGAKIFPLELVKETKTGEIVAKTKGPIHKAGPKLVAFFEGIGVVKKARETDDGHALTLKWSPTAAIKLKGNEKGTTVTFHA